MLLNIIQADFLYVFIVPVGMCNAVVGEIFVKASEANPGGIIESKVIL